MKPKPTPVKRRTLSATCLRFAASGVLALAATPAVAFHGDESGSAHAAAPITYAPDTGHLAGTAEAGAGIDMTLIWIGEVAGFTVDFEPGLGTVENAMSFEGLTVEQAIRKLLNTYSFALFYAPTDKDTAAISRVLVLGRRDSVAAIAPKPAEIAQESPERKPAEAVNALDVREIFSLAGKGDATAVAELKEKALKAENPNVRRAAMTALAGIGGTDSNWLFRIHGLNDPDPGVRIAAARSLIRTDRLRGAALVKTAALQERDAATRVAMEELAADEPGAPGAARTPGFRTK